MRPLASPEPGRAAGVVAVVLIAVALAVAVSLTEYFVATAYRETAIRLLAALVLFLAVSPVRAIVRAAIERRAPWGAHEAIEHAPAPHAPDPRFARFHDEIRSSARSQSYFEHLLWPRLVALAQSTGVPADALEKPRPRSFGRGPSIAELTRLIAALERRR
jgi:hypothetical protein